ncbi:MAG: DUF2493 domain-containing protein [Ruminococcaceae bacterium]|nr:DUF2493 domain-containing protein [Oscillospiraceae bacterium]
MKIAVIGSRGIYNVDLSAYIGEDDEIVSGGAVGVDRCAERYARENGLKLTVFFPNYKRYGRPAPLYRNQLIVDYADKVIAFWDGQSRGTMYTVEYARKVNKPCEVITLK